MSTQTPTLKDVRPAAAHKASAAKSAAADNRAARQQRTKELFKAAAEADEKEQRRIHDQIVVEHMEIADSVARRYSGRSHDWSDLRQVACLGLVKAVSRFDPVKGDDFVSYAVPTISGEVKRYLRDHGWVIRPPRHIQDLRTTIGAAAPRLSQDLGRPPTRQELARDLGEDVKDVEEAMGAHESLRPASIDAATGDGEGQSIAETMGALEAGYERAEAIAALAPACRRLTEREQRILHMRFFQEMTQQQIGERLGVTQMQVSRLLSQILGRLREELNHDETEEAPGADRASRSTMAKTACSRASRKATPRRATGGSKRSARQQHAA